MADFLANIGTGRNLVNPEPDLDETIAQLLEAISQPVELPALEQEPAATRGDAKRANILDAISAFAAGSAPRGGIQPLNLLEELKSRGEAAREARNQRATQQAVLDQRATRAGAGAKLEVATGERERIRGEAETRRLEGRQDVATREARAFQRELENVRFENNKEVAQFRAGLERKNIKFRKSLEELPELQQQIQRQLRTAAIKLRQEVQDGTTTKVDAARSMEDLIDQLAPVDAVASDARERFMFHMSLVEETAGGDDLGTLTTGAIINPLNPAAGVTSVLGAKGLEGLLGFLNSNPGAMAVLRALGFDGGSTEPQIQQPTQEELETRARDIRGRVPGL